MKLTRCPVEYNRVLCSAWDDIGTCQALRRLISLAEKHLSTSLRVPEYFLLESFEDAVYRVGACHSSSVKCVRRLRAALKSLAPAGAPPADEEQTKYTEVESRRAHDSRILTAVCRLVVGELAERIAVVYATRYMEVIQVSGSLPATFARLGHDSYAASLWSSVHANYIMETNDMLAYMPTGDTARDVSPPPIPSSLSWAVTSLPDLSCLICPKTRESRGNLTPSGEVLQAMFHRCTSSSQRGWKAAIDKLCAKSEGALNILASACISALTGMNAAIHPGSRPGWMERIRIQQMILCITQEPSKIVSMCGLASRDALRLYMATILSRLPSTREALFISGNVAGALIISPFECASTSLQSCATTLSSVGALYLQCDRDPPSISSMRLVLDSVVADAPSVSRVRYAQVNRPTLRSVSAKKSSPNWRPPSCKTLQQAVSEVVYSVFSAQFVPYWIIKQDENVRARCLTPELYDILHRQSPIHALLDFLPKERQLFVQRVALTDDLAVYYTVQEVANQLGHDVVVSKNTDFCSLPAAVAAELILYARVTAVKKTIVSWNIGRASRALQVRALAKRTATDVFTGDDTDAVAARLPKHSTHIYICVECKRVCNSISPVLISDTTHNEVGISLTMLYNASDGSVGTLRCARKRSTQTTPRDAPDHTTHTRRHNQQRRDQRTCFNQTENMVSCGCEDLCEVSILGRVVSLFGQHFVLCCFCGALMTLTSHGRFTHEPCCLHCDANLIRRSITPHAEADTEKVHKHCRYCGKRDTHPEECSQWKSFYAPQDNLGENKHVPPPLRRVVCASAPVRLSPARGTCSNTHSIVPVPPADTAMHTQSLGWKPPTDLI